jgi:hypothetical protein
LDQEQGRAIYQQDDARFISMLKELTHIKEEYIVKQLKWYEDHSTKAKHYFRFVSTLIIILSVSIPFLATLEGLWRNLVLPIVALTIAGLTGLNAFFRWENSWKGSIQAKLTLEHMVWVWNLRIAEAKHELDAQKGIEIMVTATEQLLENTQGTMLAEAEEYFKLVQTPNVSKNA